MSELITLGGRIVKGINALPKSGITRLASELQNPLTSVSIRLIGDSITWGLKATGAALDTPRSHAYTDPRNNLTCGCWANLLRDYLGKTYLDESTLVNEQGSGGALVGSGYYEKTIYIDPANLDGKFAFINNASGDDVTSSITVNSNTNCYFNRCIDFASNLGTNNSYVQFDMVRDNISVVYAGASGGTNRFVDVFVDGVNIGNWDYHTPVQYKLETSEFTFDFGRHTIKLVNRSTDGGVFRLEGIKFRKRIRVANDGNVGTQSGEWIPGSALLTSAIQSYDTYIICELGTNDRISTSNPKDPAKTHDNVKLIANHVINTLGKDIILMTTNAVTTESPNTTYFFNQGDVARVLDDLAKEIGVDLIDNYKSTIQAKIDGTSYLNDGIHPNDTGYRMIFENIRDAIERHNSKYYKQYY